MNRLSNERSPYLNHSSRQKIDWYPWSDEPFERAARENKPVFLSSGGVWCHWCHVMAQECFENDEVAMYLNALYVCVKLDRDERPDIDRRYQQAVAAMGGGSGWPLSVFLTPDRKPFYGGTYFPLEDRHGRPGFKKLLLAVNEFYRNQRNDATQYADRVMTALEPEPPQPGELSLDMVGQAEQALLSQIDGQNSGFGGEPKFPMPGAVQFLLQRAAARKDPDLERLLRLTLDRMAAGGFHDQLAGGFHRYSVDDGWFVPHFEKMADDNAWLLRNYLDAYAVFGDRKYRSVAEDIIAFTREELFDPAGGFSASQDADVTPDDEGGYFTWTDGEIKALVSEEEYDVVSRLFFHERGRLPHDPAKRVLCAARTIDEVAHDLARPAEAVEKAARSAKRKLLAERSNRIQPFIDRTLYTNLNGMYITSFLKASRILGEKSLADQALRSLDRILRERQIAGELQHVDGVAALLDDHIYLIEALVAAYEATGDGRYRERAQDFMDRCLAVFGDPAGGFFDTGAAVLGSRFKRIEDTPHPSENAVAILLLIRLHAITGKAAYRDAAERALRVFAPTAQAIGVHAGMYDAALDAWFSLTTLTIEAAPESALAAAARACAPNTVLIYGEDRGRVVPCAKGVCSEPITEAGAFATGVRFFDGTP